MVVTLLNNFSNIIKYDFWHQSTPLHAGITWTGASGKSKQKELQKQPFESENINHFKWDIEGL